MGNEIKLIVFDFDGTLGDTHRNIVATMQMTMDELQLPVRSEAECTATIGLPLSECFTAMYPDLPADVIRRCTDTYKRIFQDNLHNIEPKAFPRVKETLSALKQKGYTLTIASSRSHESLVELVGRLHLADYFAYIVGGDDVKEAKPKPEPVTKTLAAMHCEPSQTLVVGDMAVDILMGANAGTRTCGVTYGNGTQDELTEAGADYTIDSIDKLIDIL